jgi:hypothetical protein
MPNWKLLLLPAVALASMQAFAGCYTVYDHANHILYQSAKPPVDMSQPIHDTLPQRFPGGSLVFDTEGGCPVVTSVAMGNGGPVTQTASPLLTDASTARRLGLPHKIVGPNIAVVPAAAVGMEPGVTVVPTGASVASKSPRHAMVITEYRNPPVTVVRRGNEVTVSENR